MLAVTQFEVYVLAKGRWTLHARYAGDDKHEAIQDARSTEASTGFPAKIVRETFFPELNDSERITTYISPNAKKAIKGRPVGTTPRPRVPLQSRGPRQAAPRQLNAAQMMLRVLVAAAFSVVAAAVMAFVIKYVLQSFADIGLTVSPDVTSMIMTYAWVAMFLLFFFSLFRSRLPLHRLLADMWQASARPVAAAAANVKPVKLKLKPKHDRGATSPETLKAWQDLRMRRGDPDIFATPADLAPDLPRVDASGNMTAPSLSQRDMSPRDMTASEAGRPDDVRYDEIKPVAADKAAAQKTPEKTPEKKAADGKVVQDKAAEDKAIQERINKAKEKSAKGAQEKAEKAVHEKAAADKAAADKTPLGQKAQDTVLPPDVRPGGLRAEDDFAHTALRSFISDVVKPAALASMRDDPVARRGIALVIAGAIDGIAARPEARGLAQSAESRALLAWGLRIAGLTDGVAGLFMQNHDAAVGEPANQSLVATGQGLMADMIPLQSPDTAIFAGALADAFAAWRTPFGQAGVLVGEPEAPWTADTTYATAPPSLGDDSFSDAGPSSQSSSRPSLRDVFLLTELRPLSRHDDAVLDDARMSAHNDRVRAVVSAAGGQEIKHTGKGIFARFTDPAAALGATKDLQRDLGRAVALSLIGNTDAAEDPIFSPNLFLRAETAIGSTGDGQASVEAHVIGEDQKLGQPTNLATDLVILVTPPALAPGAEVAVA